MEWIVYMCYSGLNCVFPQPLNSYVKDLSPSVTVFADRTFLQEQLRLNEVTGQCPDLIGSVSQWEKTPESSLSFCRVKTQ